MNIKENYSWKDIIISLEHAVHSSFANISLPNFRTGSLLFQNNMPAKAYTEMNKPCTGKTGFSAAVLDSKEHFSTK